MRFSSLSVSLADEHHHEGSSPPRDEEGETDELKRGDFHAGTIAHRRGVSRVRGPVQTVFHKKKLWDSEPASNIAAYFSSKTPADK